ncbi:hypothetical protein MMC07_009084 [Pseudocyphellaria aurata]|nr:hypothetical protein [Pseudocyphellaria aurata]
MPLGIHLTCCAARSKSWKKKAVAAVATETVAAVATETAAAVATETFSTLPVEIHVNIASHCENSDLINLCLTSKWMNERCLRVLYRHVDLEVDRSDVGSLKNDNWLNSCIRQRQLACTLACHPEYGKHVRVLKAALCLPRPADDHHLVEFNADKMFWRAMQSLTQVRRAEVGYRDGFGSYLTEPAEQTPCCLFQSATSVRLIGHLQYNLVKSILRSINPATLKNLSLDMVQEIEIGMCQHGYAPGDKGEDGRVITYGTASGLLTTLIGRCTTLQTLELRRLGQGRQGQDVNLWHPAAEEASYVEWASFMHSVKGTVESVKFEQAQKLLRDDFWPKDYTTSTRVMDERFRQYILPVIVSGNWSRLKMMELRGVRGPDDIGGTTGLTTELRAVLGGNTRLLVKEEAQYVLDF